MMRPPTSYHKQRQSSREECSTKTSSTVLARRELYVAGVSSGIEVRADTAWKEVLRMARVSTEFSRTG